MGTPSRARLFNVFIDSDGPVADFDKALKEANAHTDDFKHWPGTYLWLEPTLGESMGLNALETLDKTGDVRVWIATKTPSRTPYAYTEKVLWYRRHFPWLEDRIILTHDKSLLGSSKDILLDDRPHKANADQFSGTFVFFDVDTPFQSWTSFLMMVHNRLKPDLDTNGGGITKM